jgi:uncharacterized protein
MGDHTTVVRDLITGCPWLMGVLGTVRDVGDRFGLCAWVGAGAVRDLAWDTWYGREPRRGPAAFDGSGVKDVDVVFFDPVRLDRSQDAEIEAELGRVRPDVRWDVTNQAAVHLWYEQRFGYAVEPLTSVADGVATWPETATAVAVRRTADDAIEILAPLGLDDLVGGVHRRNPRRVSVAEYRRRILRKDPATRWPGVELHG